MSLFMNNSKTIKHILIGSGGWQSSLISVNRKCKHESTTWWKKLYVL